MVTYVTIKPDLLHEHSLPNDPHFRHFSSYSSLGDRSMGDRPSHPYEASKPDKSSINPIDRTYDAISGSPVHQGSTCEVRSSAATLKAHEATYDPAVMDTISPPLFFPVNPDYMLYQEDENSSPSDGGAERKGTDFSRDDSAFGFTALHEAEYLLDNSKGNTEHPTLEFSTVQSATVQCTTSLLGGTEDNPDSEYCGTESRSGTPVSTRPSSTVLLVRRAVGNGFKLKISWDVYDSDNYSEDSDDEDSSSGVDSDSTFDDEEGDEDSTSDSDVSVTDDETGSETFSTYSTDADDEEETEDSLSVDLGDYDTDYGDDEYEDIYEVPEEHVNFPGSTGRAEEGIYEPEEALKYEEMAANGQWLNLKKQLKRQLEPSEHQLDRMRAYKRLRGEDPNLCTPTATAEGFLSAVTPEGHGRVIRTHNYLTDDHIGILPRDGYRSLSLRR